MKFEPSQPFEPVDLEFIKKLPADCRAHRIKQDPDPESVLMALAEEAAGLTVINADRALETSLLVRTLADELEIPAAQARSRRSFARALSYTGRFAEALEACAEAVTFANQAGRHDEAGRASLASMHPLLETGRLDEAITAGESARTLFLDIDAPQLAARADINLGAVYQRRDQPSVAVTCFERARPALIHEPLTLGHLENNCGEALLALNDFAGAEAAFRGALHAFEAAGAELTAAIAAGNLADLAVRQGQPATALMYFERARRRLESTHSPAQVARLIAEQADVKAMLGLRADALADYEASISDLDQCGLAIESARARAGMGHVLFLSRRFAEAETALAAAATGFDELGHTTARAKVDLIRAEMAAFNGRLPEARSMAWRALSALADRPADAVVARHLLARLAIQSNELELADAELAAALTTAQAFNIAPLLADLLQTRGRLRQLTGRVDDACSDFELAVHNIERIRLSLQAARFRAAFLGDHSVLYEDLVASLLESPDEVAISRAYKAAEQCKSRTLLDRLQAFTPNETAEDLLTDDRANDTLFAQHRRIRSDLNVLYSQLADEPQTRARSQLDGWSARVHDLETELDAVESRMAATNRADVFANPDDLADVQERLEPGERLIEYFIAHGRVHLFEIDHDQAAVHADIASIHDVREQFQRMRFQVDRGLRPDSGNRARASRRLRAMQAELACLHQMLLRPVADRINEIHRLIVVPHGFLHLVPFAGLFDGSRYLIEQVEVVNELSGSLIRPRSTPPTRSRRHLRAVVAGVADEIAPLIEREAITVARQLGAHGPDLLIGKDATANHVCHALSNADLVHIAAHGRFQANEPLRSGLKLHDRWLTVRDLMTIRMKAELVVLSGCETGMNTVQAGDELVGLLRGFRAAGALSVLTSLWRVGDQATLDLMSHFYNLCNVDARDTHSLPSSLQSTQLAMMQHHPHPAHWAPFFLIGGN